MACIKIGHQTRDDAVAHVKSLVWRNHVSQQSERSAGLGAYLCDRCGRWHVGHQEASPLIWHYTVKLHLAAILEADALTPARARVASRRELRGLSQIQRLRLQRLDEPSPLLWFSRNPDWEQSVMKSPPPSGRARSEVFGGGLVRFGIQACYAKLRWDDYLARNHTHPSLRKGMARAGNPAEWLATDRPVPLSVVRTAEVYYEGEWASVTDVADKDFDAYMAIRLDVYQAAACSLATKLDGPGADTEVDLTDEERILLEDGAATASCISAAKQRHH